ncbi:MAG: DUF4347 domain-containing protein [Planctomycetales bacterium]|nr:DUF4347 domain-containing protein [Planctomycetales bacterium]
MNSFIRQRLLRKPNQYRIAPWQIRPLEQRCMLAADVAESIDSTVDSAHFNEVDILVIDANVESADLQAADIGTDTEVVMLNASESGIDQISRLLQQRTNVRSLQIISHGDSATIQLGSDVLNEQNLQSFSSQLKSWRRAFSHNADILLFGCQVGANQTGQLFIRQIAELTGTDVAASDDLTGDSTLGGDWILETTTGRIEANFALSEKWMSQFQHTLPISVFAAGQTGLEEMQLLVGGQVVQTWSNIGGNADSGQFQTFTANLNGVSANDVRIAFTNDFYDPATGVDYNLRIDRIEVDGEVFQTEDPSVYSTGTWDAGGLTPGFKQSEYLHSNGYFQFASNNHSGSLISIRAAGQDGAENMQLEIDGQVVANWNSIGTNFREFTFTANQAVTADQIRITFTNDAYDVANGIDRNLIVDRLSIDGRIFETEAPSVYSTGTWANGSITPGYPQSETLHANGYFQYAEGTTGSGSQLIVRASGSMGDEQMQLQIDGQTVASWTVTSNMTDYSFVAVDTVTADQIRVAFINDLYDPANGVDRNLQVDFISVDGVVFQSEAPNTYSTGTWENGSVTPGFPDSETLHVNGYFQYQTPTANGGKIQLAISSVTVGEEAGSVTLGLERVEGSEGIAQVFIQTLATGATDGLDFIGSDSRMVEFQNGQTSANVVFDILNDGILESVETFSVSLYRALGADLGAPRTAIVTIVDDEAGSDLIGHWRLDENSIGQPVVDASVFANSGSMVNFAPPSGPSADKPNVTSSNAGSYSFDGVNDFVQIGPDADLILDSGQFTQSVWIKPNHTDSGFHGVLGYQNGSAAQRAPGIWVYQETRIHVGFGDGTNWNSFITDSVLTENQWNHVAATFDGSTYRVFVNGVQAASRNDFAGRIPVAVDRLDIGRVDNYFRGGIDDVRIYNRAISAAEVVALIDGADVPNVPISNDFTLQNIASGFVQPLAVEFLSDGRMLVSEQRGTVRIVNSDGSIEPGFLLDIRDIVNSGTKDRGMLGFAIHPDFENNPYVYVSYTYDPPEVQAFTGRGGPDGNGARVARISRFTVNAAGTFADPASEFVLVGNNSTYENIGDPFNIPSLSGPFSAVDANGNPLQDAIASDELSHTIGDLEFGPDGYLYAASGDGGSFGRVDPINLRSLDIDSLNGKILRIDPITGQGPASNPYFDGNPNSNRSKVYQLGLRNPFRFAINRNTGDVAIGDVGWTQWEEINIADAGANFGWPAFEGDGPTGGYQDLSQVQAYYATNPNVAAPAWARLHSDGARAIIMGDYLVGSNYPAETTNALLFTDIGDQLLRAVQFDASGAIQNVTVVSEPVGFLVDMHVSPLDRLVYYVDLAAGTLGRLQYQTP